MSTRTNLRPQLVITNGDLAGSLTSLVTILQSLTLLSYSLSWTGTIPIGDISVEVSNDYSLKPDGTVANAGTWTTLAFSVSGAVVTSIPLTGNTGTGFINIGSIAAYAIRLKYTRTSGTGTLNVTVNGKVQ